MNYYGYKDDSFIVIIPLVKKQTISDTNEVLKSDSNSEQQENEDNIDDTKFNKFRIGNWHNITKRKFEIIHKELIENKFVCFTDGDIVFLNKNFMKFHGKPMIYWTIKAAKKSRIFDKVIVSTDSKKIAKIAQYSGAEVPFLRIKKLILQLR